MGVEVERVMAALYAEKKKPVELERTACRSRRLRSTWDQITLTERKYIRGEKCVVKERRVETTVTAGVSKPKVTEVGRDKTIDT